MTTKRKRKKREPTTIERADIELAEALDPVRKSKPIKVIGPVAELGDQPPLYALTAGVMVAGLALRNWHLLRTGARMMAAHAAATSFKTVGKLSIDRTRPAKATEQGSYAMREGQRYEPEYNSFPSGHTASSIAVARALGRDHPEQHGLALAAAGAIASLQVLRGKHFLSDIAAGAIVGLLAEKAVDLLFRRFPARQA